MIERLATLARSPGGLALVAAWACAEAILLPVVPDVVLLPLVAAAPRATPRLLVALLGGALIGTAILATLVVADAGRMRDLVATLPGMDAATYAAVEADLSTHGAAAFAAFGPGIPLKVYTEAWVADGGSPVVLLGAAALNRLTRVGPGIVAALIVGGLAPGLLRRRARLVLAAYALAWVALYLVYWRVLWSSPGRSCALGRAAGHARRRRSTRP